MRNLKSAILFVAAMFGSVTSSFGAVTLQINALFDIASYSVDGKNEFVAWNVTVSNGGASPSSPVLFLGRTAVRDPSEKAKFDNYYFTGADPRCRSANLFPTAVGCLIPGLLPHTSITFVVSYKTPKKITSNGGTGPGDVEGTDYVNFRGTTVAAEDRDIFVDRDPRNRVTLTSAPVVSTSVCPSTGCSVSTGAAGDGNPTSSFPRATQVAVPSGDTFTTVAIRELVPFPTGACSFTACFLTQITAPGNTGAEGPPVFGPPYLAVVLRQDPSLNVGDPSLGTLVYLADGEVGEGTVVGPCLNDNFPQDTEGKPRCVPSTFEGLPNPRLLDNGVLQWRALSLSNGGWGLR